MPNRRSVLFVQSHDTRSLGACRLAAYPSHVPLLSHQVLACFRLGGLHPCSSPVARSGCCSNLARQGRGQAGTTPDAGRPQNHATHQSDRERPGAGASHEYEGVTLAALIRKGRRTASQRPSRQKHVPLRGGRRQRRLSRRLLPGRARRRLRQRVRPRSRHRRRQRSSPPTKAPFAW